MFLSEEPKLFNKITFLIAGLLMIGAAAQTSDSTTDTQTPITTDAFKNVFGGESITFALPASVSESAPVAQSACGSIGTRLGFIGIPCSVDQRTTLATISSSANYTTANRGTATVTTTVTDSHVSTTTDAPITITKTISLVTQSAVVATSTATGMCYWSNENIITPCTVTVLNTATLTASSAVPTTSKSVAIPNAHNPLKTATDLVKRSVNGIKSSVSDILTSLNTLIFSGSTETINAYIYSVLTHDRHSSSIPSHRHTHAHTVAKSRAANSINCIEQPSLYTPAIMTFVAIFNALILYCAWDPVHYPFKTSNLVALYIISFITTYLIAIYVEFFFITVGPMWKVCIATSEGWNETLAADGVAVVCNYTDMGMGN